MSVMERSPPDPLTPDPVCLHFKATVCFRAAASGSGLLTSAAVCKNQSLADSALVMVSWVVKV